MESESGRGSIEDWLGISVSNTGPFPSIHHQPWPALIHPTLDAAYCVTCLLKLFQVLDTEIPSWSKINPLPLCNSTPTVFWDLWLYIIILWDLWHYITILQDWSLRPPTTFQFLLSHFSSLALCFWFHIPASVSSFLFPIYCTISVFLLSLSTLHPTIKH